MALIYIYFFKYIKSSHAFLAPLSQAIEKYFSANAISFFVSLLICISRKREKLRPFKEDLAIDNFDESEHCRKRT